MSIHHLNNQSSWAQLIHTNRVTCWKKGRGRGCVISRWRWVVDLTRAKLEILYINQFIRRDLFHCPPHGGAIIQSARHRPSQWVVHLTQSTKTTKWIRYLLLSPWFLDALFVRPVVGESRNVTRVWSWILPRAMWIGRFLFGLRPWKYRWVCMPTKGIT